MTGDMEIPLEEYLMKKYGALLDVDILKVGHHGSSGSSSQSFLDLVTPKIATISAGAGNSYGHPTMRTLKRL
jgi:competence protein ComEC